MPDLSAGTRRSIHRHLLATVATVMLLAGGVGGWAATAELSGAVIAHGSLVVESNVKQIQHPLGGVISAILVSEGDRVREGQIVVRLDPTQAKVNLQIVSKRLDELTIQKARAEAEQAALPDIVFPQTIAAKMSDPEVMEVVDGERLMFDVRRSAREGQKAQLRERMSELRESIEGLEDQIAGKNQQIDLLAQEIEGVAGLLKKKLVTVARVKGLQRESAEVQGDRGFLVSSVAEAKSKIATTELQILQIDHDMRETVSRELGETRAQIAELVERKTAAEDELRRADIRAPLDGVVEKLMVHTIGGVVRPSETIMDVVPIEGDLIVQIKISPRDINDVRIGQNAALRFSGLNQRTTPEVDGVVELVSADVTESPRGDQSYYLGRIKIEDVQMKRLGTLRPMPGMPVEAFIKTQERTMIAYLIEPLSDQIARAFREK